MPHITVSRKRCTGCHMCELACSAYHEGAYRHTAARLRVDCNPTTAEIKGHTCLQTGCSKCREVCAEGAIETREIEVRAVDRHPLRGVVLVVDAERCTDCGDCYDVCPYGVIGEHPATHKAFKCDLCDGEPQCIASCQNPHVLAVGLKADKGDRAPVGI
jgi:Fe-S-cluster-containing hydrogenase component 2